MEASIPSRRSQVGASSAVPCWETNVHSESSNEVDDTTSALFFSRHQAIPKFGK